MTDNELRQQYRQAVGDLRVAYRKTYLYKLCEHIVRILNKMLHNARR